MHLLAALFKFYHQYRLLFFGALDSSLLLCSRLPKIGSFAATVGSNQSALALAHWIQVRSSSVNSDFDLTAVTIVYKPIPTEKGKVQRALAKAAKCARPVGPVMGRTQTTHLVYMRVGNKNQITE